MSKLRLSEAIRLGATMKPQAFDGRGDKGSCALRAACDALGLQEQDGILDYPGLIERYPVLNSTPNCPKCGRGEYDCLADMTEIIYHMNDCHMMSREEIASWVELHEPESMWPERPESEPVKEDASVGI